ncbi:hypothetical protein ES705_19937 [subsurface metagenome]
MFSKDIVHLPKIKKELIEKKIELSRLKKGKKSSGAQDYNRKKSIIEKDILKLYQRGSLLIKKGKDDFRNIHKTIEQVDQEIHNRQSHIASVDNLIKQKLNDIRGYQQEKKKIESEITTIKNRKNELEWQKEFITLCLKENYEVGAGGSFKMAGKGKGAKTGLIIILLVLILLTASILVANWYLSGIAGRELQKRIETVLSVDYLPFDLAYSGFTVNPLLASITFSDVEFYTADMPGTRLYYENISVGGSHLDLLPLLFKKKPEKLHALRITVKELNLKTPQSRRALSLARGSFSFKGNLDKQLVSEISSGNFSRLLKSDQQIKLAFNTLKYDSAAMLLPDLLKQLPIPGDWQNRLIVINDLSLNIALKQKKLTITRTRLSSPLVNGQLEVEIDLNEQNLPESEIKKGKIAITGIAEGIREIIAPQAPEGTIVLELSGTLADPKLSEVAEAE